MEGTSDFPDVTSDSEPNNPSDSEATEEMKCPLQF
jgi:hypothetical protein